MIINVEKPCDSHQIVLLWLLQQGKLVQPNFHKDRWEDKLQLLLSIFYNSYWESSNREFSMESKILGSF